AFAFWDSLLGSEPARPDAQGGGDGTGRHPSRRGADPGQPVATAAAEAAGAQTGRATRLPDSLAAADRAARPRHGALAPGAQGDRHAARGGAAAQGSRDAAAPLGGGLTGRVSQADFFRLTCGQASRLGVGTGGSRVGPRSVLVRPAGGPPKPS